MEHFLRERQISCALVMVIMVSTFTLACLQGVLSTNNIKTETFLTPLFIMKPGSVIEKFFYNINFPKGHIALKSFDVEVVDESGDPISLFDTYLHHWAVVRYYQHKDAPDPATIPRSDLHEPNFILASNNGVCQNYSLPQFYGTGSESRKTSAFVPDPYGIEVGNPKQVPDGYYERWWVNVHAIDTRGVENRLGCNECWCNLYNVTKDQYGKALEADYKGGLRCCYDKSQCKLRQSYEGMKRNLYLRYIVKWVDWDNDSVLPVKVYIFDVTDSWKPLLDSKQPSSQEHNCLVEYDVESCSAMNKTDNDVCNTTKRTRVSILDGGYLVYGMAHQHIGAVGSTLYGEDGRVLCSSSAIYGEGNEVGNEKGFIIGMSTCYPKPGSMKINDREIMTLEINYAAAENHRGVMGLFHIMVSDKLPNPWLRMEPSKLFGETTS